MEDRDFQFACTSLGDRQRLIAASKLQRWDVVKWTVTVNVALAAAAIAAGGDYNLHLSLLAAIVAAVGWGLMLYYNLRLTRTRDEMFVTENYLANYLATNGVDYSAITGKAPKKVGFFYDCEELAIFTVIQWLSIILVWLLN